VRGTSGPGPCSRRPLPQVLLLLQLLLLLLLELLEVGLRHVHNVVHARPYLHLDWLPRRCRCIPVAPIGCAMKLWIPKHCSMRIPRLRSWQLSRPHGCFPGFNIRLYFRGLVPVWGSQVVLMLILITI